MKLLDLTDTERDYYTANNSLYIDDNGQETLVNLTPAESIMYIEGIRTGLNEHTRLDEESLLRYLEIYERHQRVVSYTFVSVEALERLMKTKYSD
jgi:hypothetical protein